MNITSQVGFDSCEVDLLLYHSLCVILHSNMFGAEKLWHLPQPDFEHGDKTPWSVASRRFLRRLEPETVNSLLARSYWTKTIDKQLNEDQQEDGEFLKPAWQLFRHNLYLPPDEMFLRASPFHCDMWLRDCFFGTLALEALNGRGVELNLLSQFEDPRTHPQVASVRLLGGNRIWAFDNESTMLALIWRGRLFYQKRVTLGGEERQKWTECWNWIQKHTLDGTYISPAGTDRSWFDTFKLEKPDVLAYNQGIYAVAALVADRLRLEKNPHVVTNAIKGYQNLARSGRLQFSSGIPYKDTSSLTGEFLALHIFEEPLLSDDVVRNTFESLSSSLVGHRVITKEDNSYLDPHEFSRHMLPEIIKNGAVWPMFEAMARATAELHGLKHEFISWKELFSVLKQTKFAEYVYTGPYEVYPRYNPTRIHHLWNGACFAAAKSVLSDTEQINLADFMRDPKEVLYLIPVIPAEV